MKTSPLTSNLDKSKLVLHFSSNPLSFYPLLAPQDLLSSKPSLKMFCENEQMILGDLIFPMTKV